MESLDRLLERVAPHESHGVIRSAVAVGAQAVNRDNPRVLQAAGHLRLEQEPLAHGWFVRVFLEDLLEGDLAVQLGVERHEDGAQSALGVGPEHAEPLALAGGRAYGVACGGVGVELARALGRSGAGPDAGQAGLDVGVCDPGQPLAGRAAKLERRQGPLGVAAVAVEVSLGQRVQHRAVGRRDGALVHQKAGQRLARGGRPGSKSGDELVAADHPVVQGEQAEEEVAVRVIAAGHDEKLPARHMNDLGRTAYSATLAGMADTAGPMDIIG